MFSKPSKQSFEVAAPAARKDLPPTIRAGKSAVASLVAEGVVIRGDLSTGGDMHLDGVLEGDLKADLLTIGEAGLVTGMIEADTIEVRGRVVGVITARMVHLCATARVSGDINHTELAIDAGAHFEGRSLPAPAADSKSRKDERAKAKLNPLALADENEPSRASAES